MNTYWTYALYLIAIVWIIQTTYTFFNSSLFKNWFKYISCGWILNKYPQIVCDIQTLNRYKQLYFDSQQELSISLQTNEELKEQIDDYCSLQEMTLDQVIIVLSNLPPKTSPLYYMSPQKALLITEPEIDFDQSSADIQMTAIEIVATKDDTSSYGWKVMTPIKIK